MAADNPVITAALLGNHSRRRASALGHVIFLGALPLAKRWSILRPKKVISLDVGGPTKPFRAGSTPTNLNYERNENGFHYAGASNKRWLHFQPAGNPFG
jgi:hypothetical protein